MGCRNRGFERQPMQALSFLRIEAAQHRVGVGGSIGSALMAVVLYRADAAGHSVDVGFQQAFWWLTGAGVIALVSSMARHHPCRKCRAPRADPIAAAIPGRASTIEKRNTRNESGPGVI